MERLTEAQTSQMLTGGLEFFRVNIPVSIIPYADRDTQEDDYYTQQRVWERIIEVIRLRSNVVIVGELTETGFSFAVERTAALQPTVLQADIRKIGTMNFTADGSETKDLSTITVNKQDGFSIASEAQLVNLGEGVGVFSNYTGDIISFRSIVGGEGTEVTLSADGSSVVITSTGGSGSSDDTMITDMRTDLDTAIATNDTQSGEISTLRTDLNAVTTSNSDQDTAIADLQSRVSALETEVASNTSRLQSMEESITNLDSRILALESAADDGSTTP